MNLDYSIKNKLEELLFLKEFLSPEEEESFYVMVETYLKNRSSIDTFYSNLKETIHFYETIGIETKDMLHSIMLFPSIIHANKDDLLFKYMLLFKIKKPETGLTSRNEIIINHPKDLMTGAETIYSRIYFLSENAENYRTNDITRRKVLKTTSAEFKETYGLSKEELLQKYPLTPQIVESIINLPQNKELVQKYEENKNKPK